MGQRRVIHAPATQRVHLGRVHLQPDGLRDLLELLVELAQAGLEPLRRVQPDVGEHPVRVLGDSLEGLLVADLTVLEERVEAQRVRRSHVDVTLEEERLRERLDRPVVRLLLRRQPQAGRVPADVQPEQELVERLGPPVGLDVLRVHVVGVRDRVDDEDVVEHLLLLGSGALRRALAGDVGTHEERGGDESRLAQTLRVGARGKGLADAR